MEESQGISSLSLTGRDLVSIQDFNRQEIEAILALADRVRSIPEEKKRNLLRGKIMASLFFEASTRTRTSFNMAMLKMGGLVEGFSDAGSTSISKGESLWDTIKMYDGYDFDALVIRHPLKGSARLASEATRTPVINAGDGSNQHPTQTLLDLYTIQESQKKIDGLQIAFVGDLKYGRTVHSLVQALFLFPPCKIYFISPSELSIPDYLKVDVKKHNIPFEEPHRMEDVINHLDILFMTRVQQERFEDKLIYRKVKDVFTLHEEMLRNVKPNLRILHPLPRVHEISRDVDDTPYAYYFQQAKNGLYVRQALLVALMGIPLDSQYKL